MTRRSWFEYEYRMPGWPDWRRCRFTQQKWLGLTAEPTDEAEARETLLVISGRFRPIVPFRLVHRTDEIFDAPEDEVHNPRGTNDG